LYSPRINNLNLMTFMVRSVAPLGRIIDIHTGDKHE
jgi:hypothetical protein